MKHICLFLLAATLLLCPQTAFSQLGLHAQLLSNSVSAQQYQPALLMFQDFQQVAVEAEGGYWLGANTFTLDGIFSDGNYISEDAKDQLISQLTDNNRFQLGYHYGIHANLRAAGRPWSLSYRNQQTFFFEADDPNSIGLALYGNARYAGDTLSDDQIAVRQQQYSEFAAGTGFKIGHVRLGIRAKVLLGNDLYAVDQLSYSLYTAPDGAKIAVQSEYDIYDASGSDQKGWGLGADIGAIYDNEDKLRVHASLVNLGFISWEGNRINNSVDFVYEGFEARDFIGDNSNGQSIVLADTIEHLLFPDTVGARFTMPISAMGNIGIRYYLTDHDMIALSASQTIGRFAPSARLPLINVAYHRHFGKMLTLGANLYSGGYDIFGAGLLAQINYPIGDSFGIHAFYYLDNALGALAPGIGQGLSMNGGLGIRY